VSAGADELGPAAGVADVADKVAEADAGAYVEVVDADPAKTGSSDGNAEVGAAVDVGVTQSKVGEAGVVGRSRVSSETAVDDDDENVSRLPDTSSNTLATASAPASTLASVDNEQDDITRIELPRLRVFRRRENVIPDRMTYKMVSGQGCRESLCEKMLQIDEGAWCGPVER